jgi:hypothetical protein
MTFEASRFATVPLPASPAALLNNLSTGGGTAAAYVHRDEVRLVCPRPGGPAHGAAPSLARAAIFQAKHVALGGAAHLAVCSAAGVQLLECAGDGTNPRLVASLALQEDGGLRGYWAHAMRGYAPFFSIVFFLKPTTLLPTQQDGEQGARDRGA